MKIEKLTGDDDGETPNLILSLVCGMTFAAVGVQILKQR